MDKKLRTIQEKLKAPKDLYNNFGKYSYRSAESILEAVKPLLAINEATLTLSDAIVEVGGRVYVEATATFIGDAETVVKAYAREPEDKKGMDASQITGTASSYARKYALNGLFLIDDTKDADTNEYKEQTTPKKEKAPSKWASLGERDKAIEELQGLLAANGKTEEDFRAYLHLEDIKHLTKDQFKEWSKKLGGQQ